ncbi:MAG: BamA/TamA family outer membrane protein [Cyclobacteriaceae bacterium]|nr:BamA/TamA family outer membrane protein [Cyclobacteriaceae bacterium]
MIRLSFVQTGLLLSVCLLILNPSHAQDQPDTTQKDLIDYTFQILKLKAARDPDQSSRKVRFSFAPASSPAQQRVTLISAINLAFYRGDPAITNLSTVYFYPYTNFAGRYSFSVLSNIWSAENRFNLTSDFKISHNTYNDYGLGSSSSIDSVSVLEYNHTRLHLQVSRLVFGYFYAGIGYYYDQYFNVSQTSLDVLTTDFEDYPYGTTSTTATSGLTVNLLRNSRKNSINPDGGFYTSISYRMFFPWLGSTYTWNALYADVRKYFRVPTKKRSILATRALYWDTWGEVPYLDMPATFTDVESRVGRGYRYARFRGRGMLYGEAEYRFTLSRNQFWGGVVFVNAQSLRETPSGKFTYVNPAAGFGLRVKFNKRSEANLTFDFAFGKDSFNYYINIGEFF